MVDMDKFRLQEQENGSIVLNPGDTELVNPSGDGHKAGGRPEKDHLEVIVIVKDLNEKFHFDFADRDKVMRIVIPKLASDAGLIAAFQTNNLEALRKQKFSESLENAFISSASDFYSVLNRMSAEPDFKRLLTEFAMGEFKRGLAGPENRSEVTAAAVSSPLTELARRSKRYILEQFGPNLKWMAVNEAIWSALGALKQHSISLTEVDEIAEVVSAEPNEILAVLALLSRPASGLLKMEYFATRAGDEAHISRDEVGKHLRAWWKEKTMPDDAWRLWAGNIVVKWSPVNSETAQRATIKTAPQPTSSG